MKITAPNHQCTAINYSFGNLLSRLCVNQLNRCSCNIHVRTAFLLREVLLIDQTNGLIFIHRQDHFFSNTTCLCRGKFIISWHGTYPSAFSRTRHEIPLLFIRIFIYGICHLYLYHTPLLEYVNNHLGF